MVDHEVSPRNFDCEGCACSGINEQHAVSNTGAGTDVVLWLFQ